MVGMSTWVLFILSIVAACIAEGKESGNAELTVTVSPEAAEKVIEAEAIEEALEAEAIEEVLEDENLVNKIVGVRKQAGQSGSYNPDFGLNRNSPGIAVGRYRLAKQMALSPTGPGK